MHRVRSDPDQLRRRRRALGDTQLQFAHRCGVHRSIIARAESDRTYSLSLTSLFAVADALKVLDLRELVTIDAEDDVTVIEQVPA